MKKKLSCITVTALVTLGIIFGSGVFQPGLAGSTEKPIKWRFQSCFPFTALAYKSVVADFVKDVKEKSNGRLIITPYSPGSLAKPMETYDAVAAGAVDMGFACGLYHARKVPEALFEFGLPLGFKNTDQCYDFYLNYEGGEAMKLLREAYAERGTYLIAVAPTGQYGYMTKFPVNGIDDFKGKKLRGIGLFGILAQKLGASPVSIPGVEQYMALQRGTIDGTLYPVFVLEDYKLKEVVNYVIKPFVLATPTIDFYANLEKWNELPDDLKKIVSETLYHYLKSYSKIAVKLDVKNIKIAEKERGLKVMTLPEKDAEKFRDIGVSIWEVVAKKNPRCKKLVDMQKEYLKEKGEM